MSNKYNAFGALGNTVRVRTDRTWIITFPDGDEVKFRIDMTERVKRMMSMESKIYG